MSASLREGGSVQLEHQTGRARARSDAHLQAIMQEVAGGLREGHVGRDRRGESFGAELHDERKISELASLHHAITHLEHSLNGLVVAPRTSTRKHLDEDAAERPDVGFGRVALVLVVDDCARRRRSTK